MDQNDLEAVPPFPEEDVSSTIGDQRRSFFSRRKKAVVAVVSIVLVAAIAVGVAVSMKPNKQSADKASAMITNPTEDAIDVEPESTAQVVDDEALDIIIDVGYEPEYPEDLIFDGGYEQREPEEEEMVPPDITAEEKVPFEDTSVQLALFEGPVTDFIVTPDVSRITTSAANTCSKANEGLWRMTLQTDNYPWETSWQLVDGQGKVVASGPPPGRNYARSTAYIGQMCLKAGQYTMKLEDKNKDGFCCMYGQGSMNVKVNGRDAAKTDGTPFSLKEYPIVITPSGVGNPTPNTPRPTMRPTQKPVTIKPTTKPLNQNSLKCVDVKVVTDRFAGETSYKFSSLDGTDLIVKNKGDFKNLSTYKDTVCVKDGRYRLVVTDPFQGIMEGGYYSVAVDGEEIMFGDKFTTGSQSHIIRVGIEPQMTNREKEWLASHNSRRKKFHEGNGKTFKRLVWSNALAEDASNWVDKITPTCKIVREPGLKTGENIAARTATGQRDEGPETILSRWVDSKMGKGYQQSLTQVNWMGTRWVGCSEKAVKLANGNTCYVTVCRYARAGNCAVSRYPDWQTATLTDRTSCGPICPDDDCA